MNIEDSQKISKTNDYKMFFKLYIDIVFHFIQQPFCVQIFDNQYADITKRINHEKSTRMVTDLHF